MTEINEVEQMLRYNLLYVLLNRAVRKGITFFFLKKISHSSPPPLFFRQHDIFSPYYHTNWEKYIIIHPPPHLSDHQALKTG